jgi:hypothetical protein
MSKVTHKCLGAGNDLSSHEIIINLDSSFFAGTNDKSIVVRDFEVNAFHICDAVAVFDVLQLLVSRRLAESVELQL